MWIAILTMWTEQGDVGDSAEIAEELKDLTMTTRAANRYALQPAPAPIKVHGRAFDVWSGRLTEEPV